ncbi:hypothetical protein [Citricoccus nitrophenolicus]|uniref:hypothetical protein n=1 Tax=Citricoccus nitrophenolicus TaxID=863575 RepID=UPI0039B67FA5
MIELLAIVLPLLLAGVVGYVFGFLRDANKANVERRAKHHDQVLEASARVLDASADLGDAHQDLRFALWRLKVPAGLDSPARREELEQEKQDAYKAVHDARTAAQPQLMTLTILAPELDEKANEMIYAARIQGDSANDASRAAAAHMAATDAFRATVREHLKITKGKPPRQWRPWIGAPLQWARTTLQWVRRLFLE